MSWTLTVRQYLKFLNDLGETRVPGHSFTVTTNTKAQEYHGSSDDSGWDTLYDASQTTIPPIGDSDPGDAPFYFWIKVEDADAILKITDDAGGVTYVTLRDGQCWPIGCGVMGSTTTSVIEQIDIQAESGETVSYDYILQHD